MAIVETDVEALMHEQPRAINHFCVSIYHCSSRKSLRGYEGTGAEWQLRPTLSVPYRDESYTVRIDTIWAELLQGKEDRIEKEVDGLCTIIKFGDTMQLREPFRVVIEIGL